MPWQISYDNSASPNRGARRIAYGKKYKTKHQEDAKKLALCVKFFGIGEDGPHHALRVLASAKTRYRLA
jgi:hypothetical protein